jgi:hypothetical protein
VQKVHSTRIFLTFVKDLFCVFCLSSTRTTASYARRQCAEHDDAMSQPCDSNVTLQKPLCGGAKKLQAAAFAWPAYRCIKHPDVTHAWVINVS